MPHNITAMLRAFSRIRICSSALRGILGSMPRSASLAPSSTMTASVPSGTDQSSRSSPPDVVSPDTPALTISTFTPCSFRAFCKRTGNAASPGRPCPAVRESPRTTSLIGLFAGACAEADPDINSPAVIAPRTRDHGRQAINNLADLSTTANQSPYVTRMDSLIESPSSSGRKPDTISISNVNLSLGTGPARVHILKDISLRVISGEAIGLIGPSGSGKSTLLMVMAGLERPDSGQVVVSGTAFNALDEDALARFRGRHVGIVFQSFHLIPTMTALENVAVPLELAGDPKS